MIQQRNFWSMLILSFLTCGIYALFFIYALNRDINTMCSGDNRETPDYLLVLLFSMLTCGIYGVYWYYVEGSRLHSNASKYGLAFEEDGTTILLWVLIGMVVCGIGPIIALYIIIKNANIMAEAYNQGKRGFDYEVIE